MIARAVRQCRILPWLSVILLSEDRRVEFLLVDLRRECRLMTIVEWIDRRSISFHWTTIEWSSALDWWTLAVRRRSCRAIAHRCSSRTVVGCVREVEELCFSIEIDSSNRRSPTDLRRDLDWPSVSVDVCSTCHRSNRWTNDLDASTIDARVKRRSKANRWCVHRTEEETVDRISSTTAKENTDEEQWTDPCCLDGPTNAEWNVSLCRDSLCCSATRSESIRRCPIQTWRCWNKDSSLQVWYSWERDGPIVSLVERVSRPWNSTHRWRRSLRRSQSSMSPRRTSDRMLTYTLEIRRRRWWSRSTFEEDWRFSTRDKEESLSRRERCRAFQSSPRNRSVYDGCDVSARRVSWFHTAFESTLSDWIGRISSIRCHSEDRSKEEWFDLSIATLVSIATTRLSLEDERWCRCSRSVIQRHRWSWWSLHNWQEDFPRTRWTLPVVLDASNTRHDLSRSLLGTLVWLVPFLWRHLWWSCCWCELRIRTPNNSRPAERRISLRSTSNSCCDRLDRERLQQWCRPV